MKKYIFLIFLFLFIQIGFSKQVFPFPNINYSINDSLIVYSKYDFGYFITLLYL